MVFHRKIQGTLSAPPSKGFTQRAVAAAMLANGTSVIHNPSVCADAQAALRIAIAMGAQVTDTSSQEWHITGNFSPPQIALNCGESALSARLFASIAALHGTPVEFIATGTLLRRPLNDVVVALRAFGVQADYAQQPTTNCQLKIKGPLNAACATMDGSITSQTLSGLLMALPLLSGDSEIQVSNLVSRAYVDMTIEILQAFGIKIENNNYQTFRIKGRQRYAPQSITVKGDWSCSAFWLAVAAISGSITVHGLRRDSLQPDKAILQVVQATGAVVDWNNGALHVQAGDRKPFCFDATHSPDLFPPLVLLAAFCEGTSELTGTKRLIHKESNRAITLQETFGKFGVAIDIDDDTMRVHGGSVLHGAAVSSFHDHRIAMAAACAGLFTESAVQIDDTNCVKKSYPDFFNDLKTLEILNL